MAASVALLACGGSDSTGPAASVEGTWDLQTVNGSALPFTVAFISSPLYRLEVMGDHVVVSGDGTYSQSTTTRETQGSQVTTTTDNYAGTWSQHGSQVDITEDDGAQTTATVNGNTLTFNDSGFTAVYVRQ